MELRNEILFGEMNLGVIDIYSYWSPGYGWMGLGWIFEALQYLMPGLKTMSLQRRQRRICNVEGLNILKLVYEFLLKNPWDRGLDLMISQNSPTSEILDYKIIIIVPHCGINDKYCRIFFWILPISNNPASELILHISCIPVRVYPTL